MASFDDYVSSHPGTGDAWARLNAILNDYGLGSLASFIKGELIQGRAEGVIAQDITTRPEFKTRFAVIEQRKKAGLPAISATDVVQYEKQATALMQSAGLPKGFYDSPDDFQNLMLKDVSLSELQSRIQDGYVKASQAPPEVAAQLQKFAGIGPGELAAYYLDPKRAEPLLQRQYAMAQVSGAGVRTGYGELNANEADRLASLGVSEDQAQQGFSDLRNSSELFGPGITGQDSIVNRDQQMAAEFEGNVDAQNIVDKRRSKKKAAFGGGGSFAGSQQGLTGLGSAKDAS